MRFHRAFTALAVAAGAAVFFGTSGAPASALPIPAANRFAPPERPGPPLDVPPAKLAASLACTPNLGQTSAPAVLLVPGTTLVPSVNFSWNYENALTADGIAWCAVTLPDSAMGDIATAGEYVVNAIRTVAAASHRKIDILGYSQGGMVPRWALRFWPDTRALVDNFAALDPSNHGTLDAFALCTLTCAPAIWQQSPTAHFYGALNSDAETFAGIHYTVAYSRTDEVVFPNLNAEGSSSLHTGRGAIANVAVQDVCPLDLSDHLAMGTFDPVGYALVLDSFTHDSVAKPARISPSVCLTQFQPGVDPLQFPVNFANFTAYIALVLAETPHTTHEPPLPSYVFAR